MMKNYLKLIIIAILVLVITGCGGNKTLSKNASVEDLLDKYMEGFKEGNVDKMLSSYPDFAHDYYAKYITKENLEKSLDYYGSNVKMSYEITDKVKLSEDELDEINTSIKNEFDDFVLASECYKIEGSTTIKGSKEEHTGTISELWYCNFEGTWRLIGD